MNYELRIMNFKFKTIIFFAIIFLLILTAAGNCFSDYDFMQDDVIDSNTRIIESINNSIIMMPDRRDITFLPAVYAIFDNEEILFGINQDFWEDTMQLPYQNFINSLQLGDRFLSWQTGEIYSFSGDTITPFIPYMIEAEAHNAHIFIHTDWRENSIGSFQDQIFVLQPNWREIGKFWIMYQPNININIDTSDMLIKNDTSVIQSMILGDTNIVTDTTYYLAKDGLWYKNQIGIVSQDTMFFTVINDSIIYADTTIIYDSSLITDTGCWIIYGDSYGVILSHFKFFSDVIDDTGIFAGLWAESCLLAYIDETNNRLIMKADNKIYQPNTIKFNFWRVRK